MTARVFVQLFFLKGCPLRCPWCSNPESQRMKPEKMKDAQREKFTLVGEEKNCRRNYYRGIKR